MSKELLPNRQRHIDNLKIASKVFVHGTYMEYGIRRPGLKKREKLQDWKARRNGHRS